MSAILPSEILIDKLLNNSQKTLSTLRNTFAFTHALPVPETENDVEAPGKDEALQYSRDEKLKECIS